jgi:hypothetical protein
MRQIWHDKEYNAFHWHQTHLALLGTQHETWSKDKPQREGNPQDFFLAPNSACVARQKIHHQATQGFIIITNQKVPMLLAVPMQQEPWFNPTVENKYFTNLLLIHMLTKPKGQRMGRTECRCKPVLSTHVQLNQEKTKKYQAPSKRQFELWLQADRGCLKLSSEIGDN